MEYKSAYTIIGMYYFDDQGKVQILTQSDLVIPHWAFTSSIRGYIISVPKALEFTTNLPLTTMKDFNSKIEVDGKYIEPESEEDVSATMLINTVGYHTVRIIDTTKVIRDTEGNVIEIPENAIMYNKVITIKEDLGIEQGNTYYAPITINEIVGKVYLDGEEVDPTTLRIEKEGTYTFVVVGENDYTSTYTVEYSNIHVVEAWAVFGISGGIAMLILLLVIIGRRRVIKYSAYDGNES